MVASAKDRARHLLHLLDTRLPDFLLATDPDAEVSELTEVSVWFREPDGGSDLDKCCGSRLGFFSALARIAWLPVVTDRPPASPLLPWPATTRPACMAPAAVRPLESQWLCSYTHGLLDTTAHLSDAVKGWLGFRIPLPATGLAAQVCAVALAHGPLLAGVGATETAAREEVTHKLALELPALFSALCHALFVPGTLLLLFPFPVPPSCQCVTSCVVQALRVLWMRRRCCV